MIPPNDDKIRKFIHRSISPHFCEDMDTTGFEDVVSSIRNFVILCLTEQEEFSILKHEEQAKKTA